ncbi:DUF4129 domain-containing transglutaminase family protein [Paenibacillus sp. GYB003]|uniref:DUF4129 domain-containing transglutaminase family protein n=1 Tax=Paenibacillus sp. GYB003 TaxID=2994392 RepID=UPI002F961800
MSSPDRSLVRDGVAAALLFLLLLEWLRPLLDLSEWSGVYRISPFMVAFGLFVAVDWMRLSPWVGWPIKAAVCLGLVAYLFDTASSSYALWPLRYAELTMKDIVALADRDYASFSPENRTMLFLVGWSMMITVIYASVVERGAALWFVAATLLYLLGLQLWPGVNTTDAVIRTVWFGFLLVGLQQFSRLERRFALSRRAAGWPAAWLVAVPLLLAAAVAAGLSFPPAGKSGMMKPLDAGYLAERFASWAAGGSGADFAGGGAAAGTARTGYGSDDTILGGPIKPDDSVAFTAMTEKLTYWRGEAKTFYTGKGWENGGNTAEPETPPAAATIMQEVTVVDPSLAGRLFAGGPVTKIEELVTRSGRSLPPDDSVIRVFGAYMLAAPDAKDPLRRYLLRVAVPANAADGPGASAEGTEPSNAETSSAADEVTGDDAPGESPQEDRSSAGGGDDRERFAAELQLPAALPVRVKLLAETVAMNGADDYEKARAIESYLKTNYRYRLDAPAVPDSSADFADTFLFETKEGYCDYFSTSMVVMLRSLGIPARWVKGFSPGEVTDWAGTGGGDGGLTQVTVRNRNAHSWVEAYMPGSGWTTFDPTPGNRPAAGASQPDEARAVFASAQPAPEQAEAGPGGTSSLAQRAQLARERVASAWTALAGSGAANGGPLPWRIAAALLAPLLLCAAARLTRRAALAPRGPFAPRYADGPRAHAYRALDKLWRAMFRKLGRKRPELTVREYVEALPLSELGKRAALLDFVRQYEAVRYGGAPLPRSAKRSMKELWRRIKSR